MYILLLILLSVFGNNIKNEREKKFLKLFKHIVKSKQFETLEIKKFIFKIIIIE